MRIIPGQFLLALLIIGLVISINILPTVVGGANVFDTDRETPVSVRTTVEPTNQQVCVVLLKVELRSIRFRGQRSASGVQALQQAIVSYNSIADQLPRALLISDNLPAHVDQTTCEQPQQ